MTFRARRSFGTVALFLVLSVTEGLLTHRPFLRPVVAPYTQERTPWKPDDFGHCSYTFVRKSFSQRDEVEQAASNGVEGDEVQLSEIAEDYASRHTEAESADLKDIRMVTERTQPGSAHMVSGHLQGELLKLLTRLTGAKRVLDIGTFTGYSALAFAEALPSDGVVMTLEVDANTAEIAKGHFCHSKHGHKIELLLGPGMESIDKLIKMGSPQFDIVFIDAEKRSYSDYYEKVMAVERPLLSPRGLLLADNVLFHSLVPLAEANAATEPDIDMPPAEAMSMLPTGRRGKIASALDEFNKMLRADPRVEVLMLTMRDGLTVARWRDPASRL